MSVRLRTPSTGVLRTPAEPGLSVRAFLAGVRAHVYRWEATRAALLGVIALSCIALTLPVSAQLAGDSRFATAFVFTVGTVVVAMVVIVAIGRGVVGPRRRFGIDRELARWIGKRHPAVASDLLSSVELPASPAAPWSPSPDLVAALHAATASRLGAISPQSLASPRSIARARQWAVGAIAANVAVLALAPGTMIGGWGHLVSWPSRPFNGAEVSGVPLVGDLQITLTAPAYAKRSEVSLASSSGDVRGLPGTTVKFNGRMLVPATSMELWIDPGPDGAPKTVAAIIDSTGRMTAELTIDLSAHYRFVTTSPAGRAAEALTRSIDAEIDRAPNVQLTAPDDPLEVANVKGVEIGYSIDDDFAVTSADLVWEAGPGAARHDDRGRKPLSTGSATGGAPRIQGKLIWDIAEINVASGGDVRYWIEAKDNDSVTGPKVGKSRMYHLRVVSPRARHEEALARQQHVAEKLLENLGARLTGPGDNLATREQVSRQLRDVIAELRSVAAAFEKDPHATDLMRKALGEMAERLERLASIEQRAIHSMAAKESGPGPKGRGRPAGAFAAIDTPKLIAELEDDTLSLADWLERERVEGLLDIADEISAHHKRLADLLTQYSRTKQPRLQAEIEREMRALDRAFAELAKHHNTMPEDVIDQYIHRDAVKPEAGTSCMVDVSALIRAQNTAAAQRKLEACKHQQQRSIASLEGALARIRGDRFTDEQHKLDEVMNALADVAKDQNDVAAESSRVYDSYSVKAKELAREHRREASAKLAALIDKSRKRIDAINDAGLTPFAMEEITIVERRIADVEHMVGDGDLAEALIMARQARASLDTIAGELDSALEDDPRSKWADAMQQALDGIENTRPIIKEVIDELAAMSPRPDQIMSGDDRRALDRLRRRQATNEQRARRLSERIKLLGGELPGDAARELGKKLGSATDHMATASDRMKVKDPSGARASTRAAADELAQARDKARSAARQAQHNAIEDEPIRIPGAEDHRTSERFREDLLEAMKRRSVKAPEGYDAMIKRYYQDLAK